MGEPRIEILVIDDADRLARDLTRISGLRGAARVSGPVLDERAADAALLLQPAHVAVVNLERADRRAEAIVMSMRDRSVKVLAATVSDGSDAACRALAAGACGLLPSARTASAVLDACRRALAGELVLPAADLGGVVQRLRPRRDDERARIASLTAREREILEAIAEGVATPDIARRLRISPLTVQSHTKSVLSKLGAHSKVEAVRALWRVGPVAARSA